MDNYKIKVNDEAVFAEVVALCEQISGKSFPYPNISCDPDLWIFIGPEGAFGWSLDLDHSWSGLDLKELTLPQLRDLVVLKRNDVKDATHRDKQQNSIYLTSDKVIYYWDAEWLNSAINKSNDYENYIANILTPITQPQDPALISGADALRALADGKDVEYNWLNQKSSQWMLISDELKQFSLYGILNGITEFGAIKFRLKPQTIKLELELPKPFEPKVGDLYWCVAMTNLRGYTQKVYKDDGDDECLIHLGAYRTEEEIKQVVEQLRKIRGTNS
ncbi:hypothetical protein ACMAV5_002003 [Acinetobacter baumannii]